MVLHQSLCLTSVRAGKAAGSRAGVGVVGAEEGGSGAGAVAAGGRDGGYR